MEVYPSYPHAHAGTLGAVVGWGGCAFAPSSGGRLLRGGGGCCLESSCALTWGLVLFCRLVNRHRELVFAPAVFSPPSFFWGGSSVPPSPFLQKRKLKLKFVRVKTRNLRTYLLLHHEQTILSRFDRRGRHKLLSSTHRCGSYKSDSSAIEIAFVSVALEGIASTTDASNAAGFIVIIQASQARQHGHGMRYLSGLRLEDVSR